VDGALKNKYREQQNRIFDHTNVIELRTLSNKMGGKRTR
jgi:hypothetical protein